MDCESQNFDSDDDDDNRAPQRGGSVVTDSHLQENTFRKGVKLVFDTLKDQLLCPESEKDGEEVYRSDDEDKPDSDYLFFPIAPRIKHNLNKFMTTQSKLIKNNMHLSKSNKGHLKTPLSAYPNEGKKSDVEFATKAYIQPKW